MKEVAAEKDIESGSGDRREINALKRNLEEMQSRVTLLHKELEDHQKIYINPNAVGASRAFRVFCCALRRRFGLRKG